MAVKVLSLKQLKEKKYDFLPDIPSEFLETFGRLTKNFTMIIYGESGNGKSNLIMSLVRLLLKYGRVLYVSYEEGHEVSMNMLALRQLPEISAGICFADFTMTYDELVKRLKKKRSEQFIILDSLQYMRIRYEDYIRLKELFPKKSFIYISHANGKKPRGKVAEDIEYDCTIKVFVKGFIAFIKSRLGGNTPYIIWEEGAKKYWGSKFNEKSKGPTSKLSKPKKANEKVNTNITSV